MTETEKNNLREAIAAASKAQRAALRTRKGNSGAVAQARHLMELAICTLDAEICGRKFGRVAIVRL